MASAPRQGLFGRSRWRKRQCADLSGRPNGWSSDRDSHFDVPRCGPPQGAQHGEDVTFDDQFSSHEGPGDAELAGGPHHAVDGIGRTDDDRSGSIGGSDRAVIPKLEAHRRLVTEEGRQDWGQRSRRTPNPIDSSGVDGSVDSSGFHFICRGRGGHVKGHEASSLERLRRPSRLFYTQNDGFQNEFGQTDSGETQQANVC